MQLCLLLTPIYFSSSSVDGNGSYFTHENALKLPEFKSFLVKSEQQKKAKFLIKFL